MGAWQQSVLAEIGRSALAASDLAAFLQQAVEHVANGLGVRYSAIIEILADPNEMRFRAGVGWPAEAVPQGTPELATAAALYALQHEMPVLVENWPGEPRFCQPALLQRQHIFSSLRVPISVCGQPFGVIGADSTVAHRFSSDDVRFLQSVAHVLGITLQRQRELVALQSTEYCLPRIIDCGPELLVAVQACADHSTAHDQAILEERQRLARDLHDSVTQSLYGITLYAEAASRTLALGDLNTVAGQLHELQDTAQEALQEMRLLIFELRPPVLEQEGLVAALRGRLEAVEGRSRLDTELNVSGEIRVSPLVEQALYRIAQETLNNVLKHACARHITLTLQQEQRAIRLEIADDGVGFDPAAAQGRGGMGLRGINERVQQLHGTLFILSTPQTGTRVIVEVPL